MRLFRKNRDAAPSPLHYDEAPPRQRAVTFVTLALVMTLTWLVGKVERRLRSNDH